MGRKNTPRYIFDNPDECLDFLTLSNDRDFEGQHFDRKQALRAGNNGAVRDDELKTFKNEKIVPTLSGFANQNHNGGLLVLGVNSSGQILGMNHLNENQINSLASIDYLKNHKVQFKIHEVDVNGLILQIGLFYSGFVANAICETIASPRRAWRRSGLQNIELSDEEIEGMKRDKNIVSFERTNCCLFDEEGRG